MPYDESGLGDIRNLLDEQNKKLGKILNQLEFMEEGYKKRAKWDDSIQRKIAEILQEINESAKKDSEKPKPS